ncbi:hypothetical protein ACS0TY_016564 [Phlomoides rotata]
MLYFCSAMMTSSQILLLLLCCLYFFSASPLISGDVFEFEHQVASERRLLQAQVPKTKCSYNFDNLDYTVITSVCKGPEYPQEPCCDGFKKLVCPYVDYFNNATTTCADDIVSSIQNKGKYPDDLFFRLCRDGKDGLVCPASPSPSPPALDQNAAVAPPPPIFIMLQLFTLLFFSLFHFNI